MKQKTIFSERCYWCKTELILNGKEADSYVVSSEHKHFCKIHTPGKEPEKDCMDQYIKAKPKKPKLTDKITAIKKLDELKQFLNKRQSYNR